MPDADGKLSEEEKQAVADWFAEKTALIGKCPLCGARSWTVLSHLMHVPAGSHIMSGRYSFAGLCCSNCADVHLIAADDIGLIKRAVAESEPSSKEGDK